MDGMLASDPVTDSHKVMDGCIDRMLSEEVHYLKELLITVDKEIEEATLARFGATFDSFRLIISNSLYSSLNGVYDPYEVNLKIQKAQRDLVEKCLISICQHYTAKPEVVETLKGIRRPEWPNPFPPYLEGYVNGPLDREGKWEEMVIQYQHASTSPAEAFVRSWHEGTWEELFFSRDSLVRVLHTRLPITRWLPGYFKDLSANLQGDILAAITVGFMLIPQSMAYAFLAGLPPIYGLYSALTPLIIYTLLGTSSELAIGPVAMVSLLVPSAVANVAATGTREYNDAAFLLAMITGIILCLAACFKVGFLLENLLSHTVLNGFISGAAIIIAGSQLKHLLQTNVQGDTALILLFSLFSHLGDIRFWPFLLGVGCMVATVLAKKFAPRFPIALCLLIITTLLSYAINAENSLKVVGKVPGGLPEPKLLQMLTWKAVAEETPSALIIAVIGFIETVAVAKKFAAKKQYSIDVTQELYALGFANMVGSFFGSYPVAGSLSRTAVNYQSGARTQMASLFTAMLIGLTVLFLTKLFYHTPKCVLAAIVISAAISLVDVHEPLLLLRVGERLAFVQYLLVLGFTLCLGPEIGSAVAVGVSLLQLFYLSAGPKLERFFKSFH